MCSRVVIFTSHTNAHYMMPIASCLGLPCVCVCVYSHFARPISYALTPILPFDASTWLFLFVTMNVCTLLYYAIKWISELLASYGDNGHGGSMRSPDRFVV